MDKKKESIECREKGCRLTGVWSETNADGKTLVCFRTRHRGQKHIQKLSIPELIEISGAPLSEIEVFLVERHRKSSRS